jgi:hypothetical protein
MNADHEPRQPRKHRLCDAGALRVEGSKNMHPV